MKRAYRSPGLREFGLVGNLTLGANGNLPDYTTSGLVNNNCSVVAVTFVVGTVTFTTNACGNAPINT